MESGEQQNRMKNGMNDVSSFAAAVTASADAAAHTSRMTSTSNPTLRGRVTYYARASSLVEVTYINDIVDIQ